MSGGFNLDDYVDVAERIRLFYEAYPDGRLTTHGWATEMIGQHTYIVCRAQAWRAPDDPHPCDGVAWEPFPGPTPYTRDSELMNAQTSAWGRAIIAAGIPSKKIASQQEVQARQAPADNKVTPAQHRKIGVLVKKLQDGAGEGADWVEWSRGWVNEQFGKHSRAELTVEEAGKLIDRLEQELAVQEVPFS